MPLLLKLWYNFKRQVVLKIEKQLNHPRFFWILLTGFFSTLHALWLLIKRKKKKVLPGVKICVGNITIGGNGKTPFLIQLAKDLEDLLPAIVSKGYKREKKGTLEVLAQDYSQVGDEPLLIKKELPKSRVFVTESRYKFALDHPFKCMIFDDGLHDRKLDYTKKIVLFDKKRFFQKPYLLPTGIFRDFYCSLKNCDLIAVKGHTTPAEWEHIIRFLKNKKIELPLVNFSLKANGFIDLKTGLKKKITGKTAIFCGIGNPKSFIDTLEEENIEKAVFYPVLDHETLSYDEFFILLSQWQKMQVKQVVMTKKDAIKIKDVEKLPLPIFYLDTAFVIEKGKQAYTDLLTDIIKKIENLNRSDQYGN